MPRVSCSPRGQKDRNKARASPRNSKYLEKSFSRRLQILVIRCGRLEVAHVKKVIELCFKRCSQNNITEVWWIETDGTQNNVERTRYKLQKTKTQEWKTATIYDNSCLHKHCMITNIEKVEMKLISSICIDEINLFFQTKKKTMLTLSSVQFSKAFAEARQSWIRLRYPRQGEVAY